MEKRHSQIRSTSSLMSQRKGTHIGFVLSFVIFVGFLIFLLTIIQPSIRTNLNEQNLLNSLKNNLISNVSSDLTTVSVFVDPPSSGCFILVNFIANTGISTNLKVVNDSGNTFDSYSSGSGLLIDTTGDNLLLKIRVSKEFPIISSSGPSGCASINENAYTTGLIKKEEHIFESKINDMIEFYKINYESFKSELKIPSGNEFEFSFTDVDGTTVRTDANIPTNTNIYSEDIHIRYIDENANKVSGILNIIIV